MTIKKEITKREEWYRFRTTKSSDGLVWVRKALTDSSGACGYPFLEQLGRWCQGKPRKSTLITVRGYGARLVPKDARFVAWTVFATAAQAKAHLVLVKAGKEVDIFADIYG